MKSMVLRAKLQELGVVSSYSRPLVSNDNPYSEALFRTVKYHPRWPSKGFASLDDTRIWVKEFVQWYNHDHRHTGKDVQLLEKRHALYSRMIKSHPERWSTTTRNWQHEPIVELNPKHHKERPHEPFRRQLR